MSSASSAVTYTLVPNLLRTGRVFWEPMRESDGGCSRVIIYDNDGLFYPQCSVDPPSPDYVPGPEHPPSPDYVPGPEHPPSPIEIPYVPEPEYPENLVPSENEAPIGGLPLPADPHTQPSHELHEDEHPFRRTRRNEDEEESTPDSPADSSAIPVVDPVPSAGDTEAFETDESAPTPRPPQIRIPFA
ncbi:hypothetical protein Tco_0517110 [Tanacetum coccineum]